MNAGGPQQVANGLRQQAAADRRPWDQLIINQRGTNNLLRILSPNQAMVTNPSLFAGYYEGYVQQVYQRFEGTALNVDTQAASGNVSGRVSGGALNFNGSVFGRP